MKQLKSHQMRLSARERVQGLNRSTSEIGEMVNVIH